MTSLTILRLRLAARWYGWLASRGSVLMARNSRLASNARKEISRLRRGQW